MTRNPPSPSSPKGTPPSRSTAAAPATTAPPVSTAALQKASPLDVTRVAALTLFVSLARVGLAAASEGFLAKGLTSLSFALVAARFLDAIVAAFVALLVLRIVATRARARVFAFVVSAGLTYAFLSLLWPAMPLEAPGWKGARAWAGQGVAIAGALGSAYALVHAAPRLVRRERFVWLAAFACVLGAAGVRIGGRIVHRSATAPPNVIVISLDSVRADRLGCAGSTRGVTPNLDAFARQAVRFENAFTPAPSTLMAHASLLTGEPASGHGASEDTAIDLSIPTMAEWMHKRGYDTIAQVGDTPWLDTKYGFARGFDTWRAIPGGSKESIAALDPLWSGLRDRRFFMFLHFDDAAPDTRRYAFDSDPADVFVYVPPYEGDYHGCDNRGRCGARYLLAMNEPDAPEPPAADVAFVAGLYDAGVRSLDRRLGRLFAELEASGLLDDSIVVVTSDHGQAFREHGRYLHFDAWSESTHVPLLIRPPGGVAERSVEDVISTTEIARWIDEITSGGSNAPPNAPAAAPRSRIARILAGQSVPDVAVESDAGRFGWAARTKHISKIVTSEPITWGVFERLATRGALELEPLGTDGRDLELPYVLGGVSPPVSPRRGPRVAPFDAKTIQRLEWLGEPLGSPGQ